MAAKCENMSLQHPAVIFRYSVKYIWLLIFPLLRGVRTLRFDWETFHTWLEGAWLDVPVLIVMFAFGFLKWRFTRFAVSDGFIRVDSGIFFHSRTELPYCNICAATMQKSLFLRPVSASWVYIDTNSGLLKTTDFSMLMRYSDAERLLEALKKNVSEPDYTYKPRQLSMFLFSFVFSSTLSGAVFAATLFYQGARLTTDTLESMKNTLSEVAHKVLPNISPATGIFSIIILGSWLLSFLRNVFRYSNFKIRRANGGISVETGILTISRYYVNPERINYADIQQNFLTKLFRLMSVRVSCSGYGTNRAEVPVFVPITSHKKVYRGLSELLPHYKKAKLTVRPRRLTIPRYISPTLLLSAAVYAAYYVLRQYLPGWIDVISFCHVMLQIPCAWHLIVSVTSFFTSGLGTEDGIVTIKCCEVFSFHTILVSRDKITKVLIRQNLFQKWNKTCDAVVYTNSEFTKSYRLKGLPISKTSVFFDKL